MLIIRTEVRPSKIHGLGLFTLDYLSKDQIIWEENPIIDQCITRELLETLPLVAQEYVHHYGWLDEDGDFFISLDNDKFMNHSDDPNTDNDHPEFCFAVCDIPAGEELTCNYHLFGTDYQKMRIAK
jgi:SET domain-containing protein